jgi:hypothetical protein
MKRRNKVITTFDEHLDTRYREIGSLKRTEFEIKAKSFVIGEIIREGQRLSPLLVINFLPFRN